MTPLRTTVPAAVLLALAASTSGQTLVYPGETGAGKGKHIVLIAADDDYRSEESMPAMAHILAVRHGFQCTVLFSINRQTGEIDPQEGNIPGLEALRSADLMVLFSRLKELPDEQMKEIVDYTNSGRPIVGLRTSTHAFNYTRNLHSPYVKYSFKGKEFDGGYGRQILGETWNGHYGVHNSESTRGVIAPGMENHPILRGVKDLWVDSNVYTITKLSGDSRPLLLGQVLRGMEAASPPNSDKPPVPVAWIKSYTGESGKKARVLMTTIGQAKDFQSEAFRRLLVNACYWATGLEKRIPAEGSVDFVGAYKPNEIGLGNFKKGLKVSDFK